MTVGIKITNETNNIIIDSDYNNFLLVKKFILTKELATSLGKTSNYSYVGSTYRTSYDITSFLEGIPTPVLAIKLEYSFMDIGFASYTQVSNGSTFLHILSNKGKYVFEGTVYVFSLGYLPPVSGPGLQILRTGSTDVAFDSRVHYMRVVANPGDGDSVTLPNNRTFATLTGIRGTGYYWHQSYTSLTGYRDTTKSIAGYRYYADPNDSSKSILNTATTAAYTNGVKYCWLTYYNKHETGGSMTLKTIKESTPSTPIIVIDVTGV